MKKDISQIEFGTGKISVENKITRHEVAEVRNRKIIIFSEFVNYVFIYCRRTEKRVVFGLAFENRSVGYIKFFNLLRLTDLFSLKSNDNLIKKNK